MRIGNVHVVAMPRWTSFVGVTRLVIALLVLIFVATTAGLWYSADYAATGVALFTASATLIIFAYYAISLCRKPEFYNAWAILGLEIFGTIFWLVSFALCADWTATFNHSRYWSTNTGTSSNSPNLGLWNLPFFPEDLGLSRRDVVTGSPDKRKACVALMGTAAGLGALEFVLFVVVLVFFSINLHKHRVAGKPIVFATAGESGVATSTAAPLPTIITTQADDLTKSKVEEPSTMSDTAENKTALPAANGADASAMV